MTQAIPTTQRASHRSEWAQVRCDSGRIAVGVPLFGLAMMIAAGLAVDLPGQIQAEQQLRDYAESCARVGTHVVRPDMTPDGLQAINATQECLSELGYDGEVTINGGVLVVDAHSVYRTQFLSMIGISDLPVTGQAAVGMTPR